MSHPNPDEEAYFSDSDDEWASPIRDNDDDAVPARQPPAGAAGGASGPRGYGVGGMSAEERELAGAEVQVEFLLPDGRTWEHKFFMGHTVQYLKAQLEAHDRAAFPYDNTVLYLDDRVLIDPLSLNDLPFSSERKNTVRVVVKP